LLREECAISPGVVAPKGTKRDRNCLKGQFDHLGYVLLPKDLKLDSHEGLSPYRSPHNHTSMSIDVFVIARTTGIPKFEATATNYTIEGTARVLFGAHCEYHKAYVRFGGLVLLVFFFCTWKAQRMSTLAIVGLKLNAVRVEDKIF
jgi:hypothetical protein